MQQQLADERQRSQETIEEEQQLREQEEREAAAARDTAEAVMSDLDNLVAENTELRAAVKVGVAGLVSMCSFVTACWR